MWDDEKPKPRAQVVVGEELAKLSVAELEARIDALRHEISRVEIEVARKKAHSRLAGDLFKP